MFAIRNRRLCNGLKNARQKSSVYRGAIAMTLLVRQRTPRHKRRTVLTAADPVQVMLMIVAALAVTTLMALDFSEHNRTYSVFGSRDLLNLVLQDDVQFFDVIAGDDA